MPTSASSNRSPGKRDSAHAAGRGTMCSTPALDHRKLSSRKISAAPSADMALRYAPSAGGVMASSTATRVSLQHCARVAIASDASMAQTAPAATDGDIASTTPPAVCGSMRASTAPAAAGRISASACDATFADMPLSDRAARSEAAALGFKPPPPNSNLRELLDALESPESYPSFSSYSSPSPAPATRTRRVRSTPVSSTYVSSTHSFRRTCLEITPFLVVVVVDVDVAVVLDVLRVLEDPVFVFVSSNSSPRFSSSGSRTVTRKGHPGSGFPSIETATECAPASTQYTGDSNRLNSALNSTGLLNASPDGVCTTIVTASLPLITRIGFAGCTYVNVVSQSTGSPSAPTPLTTHSFALSGASCGTKK
mmetsp:Transcript_2295/g.7970  ORF Transcript_2295/g.7970 Transcript_2295/m.7970 type:complete len:367 (-) Transcript_2295:7425-8525(-)